MGFLEEFLNKPNNKPAKGSKYSVRHDKWDAEDWDHILGEIKELSVADDRLAQFVATGSEAMADTFFGLYKGDPKQVEGKEMRPSYLVNHAVIGQAMGLKEWEDVRAFTHADEIATALGCVSMEPELEILFDKLKDEQDLADKLEQQMQGMEGLGEGMASLEDMIAEALAAGDEEQAKDNEEQKALIAEQIERLQQQIDQTTQELQDQLDAKAPLIKEHIRKAAKEAADEAESMDDMTSAWGLDQGGLKRLPAERRIRLAQHMNTDKMRALAKRIGPMHRLAMAEQRKKVKTAKDEIYDIEFGNDLNYMLAMELMALEDPDLEYQFYQRYLDADLMQYKLRGSEKVAKGGIILLEDGSGSMAGDRELWAKAVGLSLLYIARKQRRDFYAVHFGGVGEMKTFDFDTKTGACKTQHKNGSVHELSEIDGILDYAECFFGGGTDAMGPTAKAMDKLDAQHHKEGAVKGDIVIVSDGDFGFGEAFKQRVHDEKARLGFRIFGIAIGVSPLTQPLNEICDGKVCGIRDLITGEDVKAIFREI